VCVCLVAHYEIWRNRDIGDIDIERYRDVEIYTSQLTVTPSQGHS
jgi:hypothetical protein